MSKKNKLIIALSALVITGLIVGLTTMAATTYGTKDDPLVTLSYLNETVSPAISSGLSAKTDSAAASLSADMDSKLSQYKSDLAAIAPSGGESFGVVSLAAGQTVTCGVGAEIMLRIGAVSSYGPDYPRLIDETDGAELTSGVPLTKNHLYMVTINGNGITADAASKVLIRGAYSIA